MEKTFKSVDQQVALLQQRGVQTNEETKPILMREGYYAVVNGYGKAFLDDAASKQAGDDRYLPDTTFDQIYQLYLFDRKLRSITFNAIMSVESTLRSLISYTFCEQHGKSGAYLLRDSYAQEGEYLRGKGAYQEDLDDLLDTLERCARGFRPKRRDPNEYENARVSWYRDHYDNVPLWVLFSDLTFGNLRYFYALMKRNEQQAVCNRLRESCGTTQQGQTLTPPGMLKDLSALSSLRNSCAHNERIYNGQFGNKQLSYAQIEQVLQAYLAHEDEARFTSSVKELVKKHGKRDQKIMQILAECGLEAN